MHEVVKKARKMSTVERPYFTQNIQHGVPDKGGVKVEIDIHQPNSITFPSLVSTEDRKPSQDEMFPPLGNIDDPNVRTPLLANRKQSIIPTKTNFFGIFLAFMSGVFFTLASGTVKYLTNIDPMELLVIRSLFQICVTLPIAVQQGHNLLGPQGLRLFLLFQGWIGGFTLVLLFYSFRLLPLGDAATIIFSSPVFVMILSHIWLREPCGFYRTFIVFFLVTGVMFITQPPLIFTNSDVKENYNVLGYVAALFGTIFTALNIVIMRKCKDVHFSVLVFQFSAWSLVISAAILFIGGSPSVPDQTLGQWVLTLLVGVFGLSGQILVAIALTHEGAGRVAVTRSMDIVLAYVLQVVIFSEVPDWKSVVGAIMVIICVIGMGVEDVIHRAIHKLP